MHSLSNVFAKKLNPSRKEKEEQGDDGLDDNILLLLSFDEIWGLNRNILDLDQMKCVEKQYSNATTSQHFNHMLPI